MKDLKSNVDFMELRLLVREWHYYKGHYPFISDVFKLYKEKFDYKGGMGAFGLALNRFKDQNMPIDFIEENKTYHYKYKEEPNKKVIRKVKRLMIR